MRRYIILNRSEGNLHLLIPAPADSWHHKFKEITLQKGLSVDILPYAGSFEACEQIAQIAGYVAKGYAEIVIEEDIDMSTPTEELAEVANGN